MVELYVPQILQGQCFRAVSLPSGRHLHLPNCPHLLDELVFLEVFSRERRGDSLDLKFLPYYPPREGQYNYPPNTSL